MQSEKSLRHQPSLTILETRNDGVRFTSSLLRSLSQEHLSLKDHYNTAQSNITEEVLSIAGFILYLYLLFFLLLFLLLLLLIFLYCNTFSFLFLLFLLFFLLFLLLFLLLLLLLLILSWLF